MVNNMKHLYNVTLLLFAGMFVVFNAPEATAQSTDTLVVEWYDETGDSLMVNSLYEAIIADTLEDGTRPANRVYKLQQGGFYYVTEAIQNSGFKLDIAGEAGDPSDEYANPPVLQIGAREDGSEPGKMFEVRGDFSLKNVIVNGKTTLGNLGYEYIDARNDGLRLEFDNVIFEYAQWAIMGIYSKGANLFITNSHFRNFHSESQPWGGRGFSVWADADTVWIENNTFHSIGGFTGQIEGATANLLWFNQNTIVNNGRQILLMPWVKNAYITNNLIMNPFWHGEAGAEISADRLASEDEQYSGLFAIATLPASYGLDVQRNIAIANNSFFLAEDFETLFAADNDTFAVRKQPILNIKTQALFDANANMVVSDNFFDEYDPVFTEFADNYDEMFGFITDIRRGVSPVRKYYWDPGRDESNESVQWPLPEDLTYSNSTLKTAAIGEYPMGNLNWYPSAKASWVSGRAAQQQAIKDLLGEPVAVTYQATIEAETGTVSGTALVIKVDDANRYRARIEAAGDIVWDDVNIGTAGNYDVVVSLRTWWNDGSDGRATTLDVNGVEVTFPRGGTGDQFNTAKIEGVAMNEGTNVVKLKKNWGYLEYQWVKVYAAGTENEVAVLWPGEADLVGGGQYVCPDGGLCLSGDSYVNTRDGGSVTNTYTSEGSGTFVVRFGYVLGGAATSATLTVNDGTAQTVELTGEPGKKLEVDVTVSLDRGSNSIKFDVPTGGVWLDRLDLFLVGSMSTSIEDDAFVDEFRLDQNYPNPFNPSTLISFSLPQTSDIKLSVYNILGQRVAVLANGKYAAGSHTVRFDGTGLASGMYLYRLEAGNFVTQKKMTLLK